MNTLSALENFPPLPNSSHQRPLPAPPDKPPDRAPPPTGWENQAPTGDEDHAMSEEGTPQIVKRYKRKPDGAVFNLSSLADSIPNRSFADSVWSSNFYMGEDLEDFDNTDLVGMDNLPMDAEEGDIEADLENGILPRIRLTSLELKTLFAPWRGALIIKLLGRRVGLRTLETRVRQLWQLQADIEMIDLPNDYFIVRFRDKADYVRVLDGGPWVILGHYLTVQKWSPAFSPSNELLMKTMIWVKFPHFPVAMFDEKLFMRMGNKIGKAVKTDKNTQDRKRGHFARMCVEVDLSKPLVPLIWVQDRKQLVEYEGLHQICFHCGKYGHRNEACPSIIIPPQATHNPSSESAPSNAENPNPDLNKSPPPEVERSDIPATDELHFGPWMVAQRRSRNLAGNRRQTPNGQISPENGKNINSGSFLSSPSISLKGSRFSSLTPVDLIPDDTENHMTNLANADIQTQILQEQVEHSQVNNHLTQLTHGPSGLPRAKGPLKNQKPTTQSWQKKPAARTLHSQSPSSRPSSSSTPQPLPAVW